MPLDWPVAPRLLKGGKQRSFVVTEMFCEACQRTAFGAVFPAAPSRYITLPNDAGNSRARSAHVAISGDRRHSSAMYVRVSSGSFRKAQAICRGDDGCGLEAGECCFVRSRREPYFACEPNA